MEERLQKIIARAGIASRRHAEQLIVSGQVTVNGRVVTELGSKADAAKDHIKVAGKLLRGPAERIYLALHKPPDTVATMNDPEGRRCLADFLKNVHARVFPIGRLEYHASGLILLTSDGEFANRVLQAHNLPQTYLLKVKLPLAPSEIVEIARSTGVSLLVRRRSDSPWYEGTVRGARADAVRSKLTEMGHPVEKLRRIAIGKVELGSLPPGMHRELTEKEVAELRRAARRASEPHPPSGHQSTSRAPEFIRKRIYGHRRTGGK